MENTGQVQKLAKVRVYPGANGDFTMYQDDGKTYDYEKGSSQYHARCIGMMRRGSLPSRGFPWVRRVSCWRLWDGRVGHPNGALRQQLPPLRYAPGGMTKEGYVLPEERDVGAEVCDGTLKFVHPFRNSGAEGSAVCLCDYD